MQRSTKGSIHYLERKPQKEGVTTSGVIRKGKDVAKDDPVLGNIPKTDPELAKTFNKLATSSEPNPAELFKKP